MTQLLAPWVDAQLLQFDGSYVEPGSGIQTYGFTALCGPGGPTPTGGGSQITTIGRARRLGYTINTGFNPKSMDFPVRFYDPGHYANWPVPGVANGQPTPQSVEQQIAVLEWMWGIGELYENHDHPATGDTPSVQVTSYDAVGTRTALVPDNWRTDRKSDFRWQVTNIQYGAAMRHANGSRWFQDLVVSCIQQVVTPGDVVPTAVRQTGRGTRSDATKVHSTTAINTVSKLCVKHGYTSAKSQAAVLTYNQQKITGSKLKGKGLHTLLKAGTVVYLPVLTTAVKRTQVKRR